MPSRLIFLPIEPYKSRYTQYTSVKDGVYETCFKEAGITFESIRPDHDLRTIKHGQVLDVAERTVWGFTQVYNLVDRICKGDLKPGEDVIYLEDFWTPGFEQIMYAQSSKFGPNPANHVKVYSFCHAQTVDPYDFTHKWAWWMRPIEKVWFDYQALVFCAAQEMLPMIANAGIPLTQGSRYKVIPVGHAFHKDVMLRIAKNFGQVSWQDKEKNVVFASRFDTEKNPGFFMNLVRAVARERDDISFTICTGQDKLNTNSSDIEEQLTHLLDDLPCIGIRDKLSLNEYYSILARSRVLFNCAFQDFISYVLLDATINGCAPLFPNWLTFPDALDRREEYLYNNMDLADAKEKLYALVDSEVAPDVSWIYSKYDDTVARMLWHMEFRNAILKEKFHG